MPETPPQIVRTVAEVRRAIAAVIPDFVATQTRTGGWLGNGECFLHVLILKASGPCSKHAAILLAY